MATTITPAIRFRAAAFALTFQVRERFMARRPSLVEAFPASYGPELVERAEGLLVRMAAPIHEMPVLEALRADLVAFNAAVEARLAA
jgi:hypothetical protein